MLKPKERSNQKHLLFIYEKWSYSLNLRSLCHYYTAGTRKKPIMSVSRGQQRQRCDTVSGILLLWQRRIILSHTSKRVISAGLFSPAFPILCPGSLDRAYGHFPGFRYSHLRLLRTSSGEPPPGQPDDEPHPWVQ